MYVVRASGADAQIAHESAETTETAKVRHGILYVFEWKRRIFRAPSFVELFGGLIVGVAFIVFSFPVEFERVGDDTGWTFVGGLGADTDKLVRRVRHIGGRADRYL